eukprot:CAMPEP_0177688772 /NCGR_PEP_ID=MMETSP0447-20121125/34826_1 /TAXON_ID=0 /ORGANISM="Stygamoeba regulata, Strain BSH-02190019" /LENGTH=468 /DNA_ID=CAMNT_0019199075 /DNA_START=187 /DNA_END=1593 /DNA_ORIENTATION=-
MSEEEEAGAGLRSRNANLLACSPPKPSASARIKNLSSPIGSQRGKSLEGWLYKESPSGLLRTWKKRYFNLKNMNLYYYTPEGTEKGMIPMEGAAIFKTTPPSSKFNIHTPDRIWHLQASSVEDMEHWVAELDLVCQNQHSPRDSVVLHSESDCGRLLTSTEVGGVRRANSSSLFNPVENVPAEEKLAFSQVLALSRQLSPSSRLLLVQELFPPPYSQMYPDNRIVIQLNVDESSYPIGYFSTTIQDEVTDYMYEYILKLKKEGQFTYKTSRKKGVHMDRFARFSGTFKFDHVPCGAQSASPRSSSPSTGSAISLSNSTGAPVSVSGRTSPRKSPTAKVPESLPLSPRLTLRVARMQLAVGSVGPTLKVEINPNISSQRYNPNDYFETDDKGTYPSYRIEVPSNYFNCLSGRLLGLSNPCIDISYNLTSLPISLVEFSDNSFFFSKYHVVVKKGKRNMSRKAFRMSGDN